MKRLNQQSLHRLSSTVRVPGYDRGAIRPGIVHLGIGAFHRAHQAVYCDELLSRGDHDDWGITGVSLRSASTRDALRPQDGLYTVAARDESGDDLQVVGAVSETLVASEGPEAVLKRMSSPGMDVVSLTVTEKGYCHDPGSGELNLSHADIVHDLSAPQRPRSAPGFLVAALARRRQGGHVPFTVVCCDNLPNNGPMVRRIVCGLARALDDGLAQWIEANVAFPCTMVDRIVPATTREDAAAVSEHLGVHDAWPVVCEPFRQWVIEDRFVGRRPRWELAGAELVGDVAPYELMKLRLLNGCHSSLAYLGYLGGYETISEVMRNPHYAAFARNLMDEEIEPTLTVPPGTDLGVYKSDLMRRFANGGIRHRTWQIAMDGSQKLPQRLLGTIRDRLAKGQSIGLAALGVGAWIRYVSGTDEQGVEIDVRDPLAQTLRECVADGQGDPQRMVSSVVRVQSVFGEDLPDNPVFTRSVSVALGSLLQRGARDTVAAWLASGTDRPGEGER